MSTVPEQLRRLRLEVGRYVFDALAAGPSDGELAVLLHGFPEFADCWTEELLALGAAGYRAVAVDQRGYSPDARPDAVEDYAVDRLVEDVLGCADRLGAERFHLVAHDWGGLVAWALASARPARLLSLSVLSTPHPRALFRALTGEGDQKARSQYVRVFRAPDHAAERALLADGAARLRTVYGGAPAAELVESNVRRLVEPGALTAALNWYRAVDEDLHVPAGPITVPTLYVWGMEDQALGREAAELTGEYVHGPYRFVALEGAGHWLPEADADRVTPLLLDHLAR